MIAGLFVALLALLAAYYVAVPLARGPRRDLPQRTSLAAEAARRKQNALTAIVDLERDLEAGKLGAEDFEVLRDEQEAHALSALKAIDSLAGVERADEDIEAEIAGVRARLACPACGATRSRRGPCPRCGAS